MLQHNFCCEFRRIHRIPTELLLMKVFHFWSFLDVRGSLSVTRRVEATRANLSLAVTLHDKVHMTIHDIVETHCYILILEGVHAPVCEQEVP